LSLLGTLRGVLRAGARTLPRTCARSPDPVLKYRGETCVPGLCLVCTPLCGVGCRSARTLARTRALALIHVCSNVARDVGGCARSRALPRTCLHRASRVCMCAGSIVVCDSCVVVLDGCLTSGGGSWDRVSPSPSLPRRFSSHKCTRVMWATRTTVVPHLVWVRCTHVLA
jgi:hypothetical protein